MPTLALGVLLVAAGPWTMCGPGGGGWIQSLAYSPVRPETLYLGCDVGGFYRSDDGGRTWSIHNTGLRDRWVEAIVPHPTEPKVLYLATLSGVHRSDDGGDTWTWLRDGFPPAARYAYSAPIGALLLDPKHPETLYAGIGNPRRRSGGAGAVFRTDDGGTHWVLANQPGSLPDKAYVCDLLLRPDGSLLATTQFGLYHSADRGATWTPWGAELKDRPTRRLACAPSRPEVLYCTVDSTPGQLPWDGGVWRSDDGGASWTRKIKGLPSNLRQGEATRQLTSQYDCLAVDPSRPETVYVGGNAWVNANLYRSDDGGESWRPLMRRREDGQPGFVNVEAGHLNYWGPAVECLAMSPLDPKRLMLGTSGAVNETLDGGETFVQRYTDDAGDGRWSSRGLEVTCIWTLACHPTRAGEWLLGYMDIGCWRTTDSGASMARCMTGVSRDHANCGTAFAWDPTEPDTVWAGFGQWGSNRGGLYLSRDAGRTWTVVPGLPDARVQSLLWQGGRLWVAMVGQGLYHGDPRTGTWQAANEGLPQQQVIDLALTPSGPLALVDGSDNQPGGLWRRRDAAWERMDREPFVGSAKELAVAPTRPERLALALRDRRIAGKTYAGGCYLSDDSGATWRRVFEDPFIQTVTFAPDDPETLVIGGTDHPYHDEALGRGVYLSRDGGKTWSDLNEGLTVTNIKIVRFDPCDPHRLLVGTGGNSLFHRMLP